ncbi:response regulator [Chloroflexota bacterium]
MKKGGTMDAIRIFLVDDDDSFYYRLGGIIFKEENMQIAGRCVSVEEAFSQIVDTSPNMVLISTQIQDMKGQEAVYWLRDILGYDASIIMLADSVDDLFNNMEDYVVDYCFTKDAQLIELAEIIKQVHRNRQQLKVFHNFIEESVELIVLASTDDTQPLQFMYDLEERLQGNNIARISKTIGTWDEGNIITILVRSGRLPAFLQLLRGMIDVAELEEKKAVGGILSNVAKKIVGMNKSHVNLNKKFRVILKRHDFVEHGLAFA